MDAYELGRLVLARDLEGTIVWLLDAAGARYFGPLAPAVVDAFLDATFAWVPLQVEWEA